MQQPPVDCTAQNMPTPTLPRSKTASKQDGDQLIALRTPCMPCIPQLFQGLVLAQHARNGLAAVGANPVVAQAGAGVVMDPEA
jgi:hypothetical protein